MQAMLPFHVARKVLCVVKNFGTAIVRTIERCVLPPKMLSTEMPRKAINAP